MESPLEEPAVVYSPFDADEAKHLHTYVQEVEALVRLSFFTDPGRGLRARGEDPPTSVVMVEIDDEAVVAAAARFRSIYRDQEHASYRRTLALLKRHVCESPLREAALSELRTFERWEKDSLKDRGLTITERGKPLSQREIIRLFLYGRYLHKDPKLSERIDGFMFSEVMRGEFLGAMHSLTHVYWALRNVVSAILDTPALLPEHHMAKVS